MSHSVNAAFYLNTLPDAPLHRVGPTGSNTSVFSNRNYAQPEGTSSARSSGVASDPPAVTTTVLAMSHDTKWLASISEDRKITLSHATDRNLDMKWTSSRRPGSICALAFSPSGEYLASAHVDIGVKVWRLDQEWLNGAPSWKPCHTRDGGALKLAWSPDSTQLVVGSSDGRRIYVWNIQHENLSFYIREPTRQQSTPPVALAFVLFSPDGRLIASGGGQGCCHIWNVGKRALQATLDEHDSSRTVLAAHFDAWSRFIVTGSDDGTARGWNALNGKMCMSVSRGGPKPLVVQDVSFSPDRKLVLVAGADGWLCLCGRDPKFTRKQKFRGAIDVEKGIHSVRFAPDGGSIRVILLDGTVLVKKLRDPETYLTLFDYNSR